MKKHFNIRISGRVQGVFFRASTKAKAEELGISGFVQNEPDGSVYIEAEGEEATDGKIYRMVQTRA
jgi:acylphosphatase